jgi:rRNA maturation RNase YbeY
VVINRQQSVAIDLTGIKVFVRRLRRILKLGRQDFNICFVADGEIERLNARHRDKARPTDVLSFPWEADSKVESRESRVESRKSKAGDQQPRGIHHPGPDGRDSDLDFQISDEEFRHFLGDIVISAETARVNARQEGHSTENEVRWLILHGLLHLLGYDHATDHGEMTALELSLRENLGIGEDSKSRSKGKGPALSLAKGQSAKGKG